MTTPAFDNDYIAWLRERSMLAAVAPIAARYAGQAVQWQRPYALAQPRAATAIASVWFTAYPGSVVTRPGQSVLATLGDPELWRTFAHIGIQAIHNGPMKQAGGVRGREFTPTVDGHFDRIGLAIDPQFGTADEFRAMSRAAAAVGAVTIDDIIPAHTGKGPDFRLAERAYADYPGLYHMVEIPEADWGLLPPVPPGRDSVNLSPAAVEALRRRGYIVGELQRVIFYEPGVKESNWSATDVVVGADGRLRRWVYLHYFKEGQPSLNWLDPSFAAARLVVGDALHSLAELGARGLRLDANGFLGVEPRPDGPAWSEGHPLSLTANQLIAGMVRKLGGFTFQELNLTVDDIAAMSRGGADLSYDFVTRPAYHHALVTGDAGFLRLMLHEMHRLAVDPASLIHALQNHDELTLELVHFWTLHAQDVFELGGRRLTGLALREEIRDVMYRRLSGPSAPYNLPFVTNGVACTMASVAAAALGIRDLENLTAEQAQQIQRLHLLMAMYNALQPGVFALSGWDLVGALPLRPDQVAPLLADGDTRWINRGAYDLMDVNPAAERSAAGLPRARALYGSLPDQLQRPDSFVSRLRPLLRARQAHRLYAAHQVAVPETQAPGLLVMVHRLPEDLGLQVTAMNFGPEPVEEWIGLGVGDELPAGRAVDLVTGEPAGTLSARGELLVRLAGHEGKGYVIKG
ncbi:MAG: maltose alpha-D-glucosyltransferase [Caldilineales bacterium]|nr:maltose alpha-D-glucosyltransferase [Caldilineales bacterium]MDW8316930.1 maltose alpha-D-glucosyltransferase [Anaerolineae bacterium]